MLAVLQIDNQLCAAIDSRRERPIPTAVGSRHGLRTTHRRI
jgi:hypothetical protein